MGNRAAKRKTLTLEIGNRIVNKVPASQRGFTLVEIMIVVFIIGLTSSLVVLSLPGRSSVVQEESLRLERAIDDLADRAVLTGDLHALELSPRQYEALRWVQGDWIPINGGERDLPDQIILSVSGEASDDDIWRLIFEPSGVPFNASILIQGRDDERRIERVRDDVGLRGR